MTDNFLPMWALKRQSTRPAAAQPRGPSTQADKQTAQRNRKAQRSIPSPPAPCVLRVLRAAEEAEEPVGRPTTRSVGRPAVAARAPTHASFTRRAEPCAPRTTRGDARECGSLRSRPRRSQSLAAAVRLARLDRRHLAARSAVSRYTFLSLRVAPLRLDHIRGRGQAQPGRRLGQQLSIRLVRLKSG